MNSILKYLIFLLIFSFYAVSLLAQSGSTVKDTDMLEKNKVVLMEDYPHIFKAAQIRNVKKLNDKHSLVSYTVAGNYYEAVVNSNRKDLMLIATCKQIPLDKLPDIVKDSFKSSDHGNRDLIRAFEVTTPASAVFYRLDSFSPKTISGEETPGVKSFFYDKLGHYKTPPY